MYANNIKSVIKYEYNKKKRRETFSSFFKLKLRGINEKMLLYVRASVWCVCAWCIISRRAMFQHLKNLIENQLVYKLPLPVVCAK